MTPNSKQQNPAPQIKALDQELIDKLYKELTKELEELIKELNNSSKIGAFGAMATLSSKVSDIAGDLKKLQHLPSMLTNPFVMTDPRSILEDLSKKYSKKRKHKS